MYKFIAQLVISAAVGLAVAAGSDANVRGYIGEALREPGVYIHESASAVTSAAAHFSSESEETNTAGAGQVDVIADENGSASNSGEDNADLSGNLNTNVQVDSALNTQNILPDFLGLDVAVDTQRQTDTSAETDDQDTDLSLWQQLGLSLGFGLDK
jgi:hypothetical protein